MVTNPFLWMGEWIVLVARYLFGVVFRVLLCSLCGFFGVLGGSKDVAKFTWLFSVVSRQLFL